jgi:hypothetical protein
MNRESRLLSAIALSFIAAGALRCSDVSGSGTGADAGSGCPAGVAAGNSTGDEGGTRDAGNAANDEAGSDEAGSDEAGGDEAGGDEAGSSDAGSNDTASNGEAGSNDAGKLGNDDAGSNAPGSACKPPDSDGLVGGCYFFHLVVDDMGFSPIILKAQNLAQTTIALTNAGTRPHDFVFGCVPLHAPGCPSQVCFPPQANIASVAPGGTAMTTFKTPFLDGIYDFRSDLPDDSPISLDGGVRGLRGQFVVQ